MAPFPSLLPYSLNNQLFRSLDQIVESPNTAAALHPYCQINTTFPLLAISTSQLHTTTNCTMTSASGLGETALVIGGSRGIGNALVKELHDRGLKVYATVRGESNTDSTRLDTFPAAVTVIGNVDLEAEGAGADALEKGLEDVKLDLVIFAAGIFKSDVSDLLSLSGAETTTANLHHWPP